MENVGGNYTKPFSPLDENGSDSVIFVLVPDFGEFSSATKNSLRLSDFE